MEKDMLVQPREKPATGFFSLKNTALLFITAVFFCALSAVAAFFVPASFGKPETVGVSVPYGAGLNSITGSLGDAGLLRSRTVFKLAAILTGARSKLKAGEYSFSTSYSMRTILDKLKKGDVVRYSVTVPEGSDLKDIARFLEDAGVADASVFLSLANDRVFLKGLGIDYASAEGLLFPDTYSFIKGEGEKKIIQAMWQRFRDKAPFDISRTYSVYGLSMSGYKLLKLASIIEKESKLDSERPKVASVFYNRMKSPEAYQRRLESCATVRYALDKKTGPITYRDTRVESPYNTYIIIGLPPTPICSPGVKSMEAALRPADTGYRYFVVRENGEHTFSETLAGHEAAKTERKKLLRKNPR